MANSMGVSMTETVGTLSAFANAGMIGSDAGTSLKTMLQRLSNPTKEAQAQMDELGISAYDTAGNFVGLESFAGQLKTSLSGLTQEQRNAALSIIFGSDAVRAANVLYSEGSEGIAGWTKAVSDSGFAADVASKKNDNLKGDIEQLSGSFETLMINLARVHRRAPQPRAGIGHARQRILVPAVPGPAGRGRDDRRGRRRPSHCTRRWGRWRKPPAPPAMRSPCSSTDTACPGRRPRSWPKDLMQVARPWVRP